jgi:RNA polymerase sigma-70 factor, ECF subfamily
MNSAAEAETAIEIEPERNFEEFFSASFTRLVRAMYLLTGSVTEAEELAQEAMARVYERWGQVRRMKSPEGYAFRIAFNVNRRRARRLGLAQRHSVREAASPDPAALAEASSDVLRALSALPARQREVLVLAELLDMTAEEIGRLLRIRSGAVRVRLHRARESFRKHMGEGYE